MRGLSLLLKITFQKKKQKNCRRKKFYSTKKTEEIKKQNEKDQKILNDENAFPKDKEAAEERIAQRNEELSSLQT